jgi:hypothetical protein
LSKTWKYLAWAVIFGFKTTLKYGKTTPDEAVQRIVIDNTIGFITLLG